MDSKNFVKKDMQLKDVAFGMFFYTSTSIFGPLLFFVTIGYFVDNFLKTKPLFMAASIVISFITTNFFILKKINKLSKEFDKIDKEKKDK